MTIDLNDDEARALMQIFHLALGHPQGGVNCVDAVMHFKIKLAQAQQHIAPKINGANHEIGDRAN